MLQNDKLDNTPRDNYDSPWKEAVESYFKDFMGFYFPQAHEQIDWQVDCEFLDQELQAITKDAELGKRLVDKLAIVWLINGDYQFIYIHIEVQGEVQKDFAERIFVYNYRIYDRYRKPVVSLAVLADRQAEWKPDSFGYDILGCQHYLKFPLAKIADYQQKLPELLTLDNPFALISAAHILTQQTRNNSQQRYRYKADILKLLYQRQWKKQQIIDLFWLLDWLMQLPAELEMQLLDEFQQLEEKQNMRYVTNAERFGIQKGLIIGEVKIIKKLLQGRFGELPSWVNERLANAKEEELELWCDSLLTAPSLSAVFDMDSLH